MRAVIQRVSSASVTIGGAVKSSIGPGQMILLGIGQDDGQEDIDWLVRKIVGMRSSALRFPPPSAVRWVPANSAQT